MKMSSLVTPGRRSKPRWAIRRARTGRPARPSLTSGIPGFIVEPDPLGLTRPLEVLVYPDRATLNGWLTDDDDLEPGSTDSAAVSSWTDEGDDMRLTMRLDRQHLELSIVAHEVTHIVLAVYAHDVLTPSARASAHITHHDEAIPELVGNLTAFVWYGLIRHGHITEETS